MEIIQGDIRKQEVDAIVNAANKTLLGGGGVDGAIHRAAGIGLFFACLKLFGCKVGQAKITKGFRLPASYIIHTVGPVYDKRKKEKSAKLLHDCYWNSLETAKENGVHSIAFPAISTGIYRYPLEDATQIAVSAVEEWLNKNAGYEMRVVFVCYKEDVSAVYKNVFAQKRIAVR